MDGMHHCMHAIMASNPSIHRRKTINEGRCTQNWLLSIQELKASVFNRDDWIHCKWLSNGWWWDTQSDERTCIHSSFQTPDFLNASKRKEKLFGLLSFPPTCDLMDRFLSLGIKKGSNLSLNLGWKGQVLTFEKNRRGSNNGLIDRKAHISLTL